jgi:hypothetical protein
LDRFFLAITLFATPSIKHALNIDRKEMPALDFHIVKVGDIRRGLTAIGQHHDAEHQG